MGIDKSTRVETFLEKTPNPPTMPDDPTQCLASMGIYIFNTKLLVKMLQEDAEDKESAHDFGLYRKR